MSIEMARYPRRTTFGDSRAAKHERMIYLTFTLVVSQSPFPNATHSSDRLSHISGAFWYSGTLTETWSRALFSGQCLKVSQRIIFQYKAQLLPVTWVLKNNS